MSAIDKHAVIHASDIHSQSNQTEDCNISSLPVTSAPPYAYAEELNERVNGLCNDNNRVFGSVPTTTLVQGIINDLYRRINNHEDECKQLRIKNADLRVENERLKIKAKNNKGAALALDLLMGFGFSGVGAALTMSNHAWKVGIVSIVIILVAFSVKNFTSNMEAS